MEIESPLKYIVASVAKVNKIAFFRLLLTFPEVDYIVASSRLDILYQFECMSRLTPHFYYSQKHEWKLLSKKCQKTCHESPAFDGKTIAVLVKEAAWLSKLKMCNSKTLFSWLFHDGKKGGGGPRRVLNQGLGGINNSSSSSNNSSKTETLDRKVRHTSWPPILKKFLFCLKCKFLREPLLWRGFAIVFLRQLP